MKYIVTGMITISIYTKVEADSEEEARKKAMENGVIGLCHQCSAGHPSEEWCTSGELDGEPEIIHVAKIPQ